MDQTREQSASAQESYTYSLPRLQIGSLLFAVLYLLIIAAAAIIRFSELGNIPLSPAEAKEALGAWQILQAGFQTITFKSPAYFSLTSVLLPFFGSSDAMARLVPAFFGLGLVILPWMLREVLGPFTALVTALLFTVSPMLAAISRTVGGDAIALFAILLTTTALINLSKNPNRIWFYAVSIALALGLSSSPLFYSGLVTLLIAWWILRKIGFDELAIPSIERDNLITSLILGIILLLALSTRFFTHLPGMAATAQIFADWITQFSLQGDLQSLLDPILALVRYEVILFPLGIFAILWALWGNWQRGSLLTYWLLAALIFILLQRGVMSNALIIPLPGYLLLGFATDRLISSGVRRLTWTLAGAYFLLGGVILINMARIIRQISFDEDLIKLILNPFGLNSGLPIVYLWVIIFALLAVIFLTYTFWYMGAKAVVQAAWVGVLSLIFIYQWGTTWHLTHAAANDPRERWVNQATDDEVHILMETIEDISNQATNSRNGLALISGVDSPVLRWYLRDFQHAQIGKSLPPGIEYEAIISQEETGTNAFGSDYIGSDFGLLHLEAETPILPANPIIDTFRWWLFFDSAEEIVEDRIVLWVRADLAQP